MKHKLTVLIITLTTLLSCNAYCQPLSTADFEKGIAQKNIQLLDVRTADEYNGGHIAQALQADWNNKEQFKSRVQHIDKSKPVYVYCAAGGRSKQAADWFRNNGYKEVYDLAGGFVKWKADGKPVEGMPNTKPMSLEAFNAETGAAGLVLVDFGAAWCPPCRKMEPVLQSLQQHMAGKYRLVKIDASVDTDLMKQVNVSEIPTFILYQHGKEVWRKTGIVDEKELEKELNR
ncbi:hypothetical protein A3860_10525 [Niastella vici]|uniref:Thioredoxin n=1 Tax=Niastella vici TaxID=1703345 RepID=A0A1V9FFJ8_9BACT|nr:rhodanese-like domain-containing protein [Niastella vici]OQP56996.1 hypothetical protein A3860_10525 [Niastella vici]